MSSKPAKMHMFGHRGSSTSEPENTFSSIQRALKECDGAEFDIQRTKDGHLVILHDETLARTAVVWSQKQHRTEAEYYSLVNTPVTQLNYDEFKDVHVGRSRNALTVGVEEEAASHSPDGKKGEVIEARTEEAGCEEVGQRLSSLPEVLDLITKLHPTKQYLVEIKADISSVPLIQRDVIQSGVTPQQVRFIGFGFETMVDIKRILPAFSSIHLVHQKSEEEAMTAIFKASEAKLDGVDFEAIPDSVTAKAVGAAHALDMEVLVYVSNKEEDTSHYWDSLQKNGVDVFTSDLPSPIFEWMSQNICAKLTTGALGLCDTSHDEAEQLETDTPKRELKPVSGSLIRRLLTQADDRGGPSSSNRKRSGTSCFSSDPAVEIFDIAEVSDDGSGVNKPPTKLVKCSND